MITDLTWNEFCERYYETARQTARLYLERQRKKLGGFHRRVDTDYVLDSAVLSSLERTFQGFNAAKGVRITTYMSRIIHNEIVDELTRESREAARKDDLEALRKVVQRYGESVSEEKRELVLSRLTEAIKKLSPSDQIILSYYLEGQPSYAESASNELGVSPNYVAVRRLRIFSLLPKLMGMSREQYAALFSVEDDIVLASCNTILTSITVKPNPEGSNPINPSVDPVSMARRLLLFITDVD